MRTIEEILAYAKDIDLTMIARWTRLQDRHHIAAGGIGQTLQESKAADKAWDDLPDSAKISYWLIHRCYSLDLKEAREELEDAYGELDDDLSPEVILGPDYPAFEYLSAQDIQNY